MTTFSNLKKTSADLDRLSKELDKLSAPQTERQNDDRFFQPEVDKNGNGLAIIRFLPAPAIDGDDGLPWVRLFSHGFQGPTGKWYIENSLTTLNQKDPLSDLNSKLWAVSKDDNSPERKQVRNQKRRLNFISNIQVIDYPKDPSLNGQIKLFRYGKKIFDKIEQAMKPELSSETPINPFNFWTGANFKLVIKNVAGFRNYDSSTFYPASSLSEDDKVLEEIWKSEYSLKEFLAPSNFKSYDELKARLEEVLEGQTEVSAPAYTPKESKRAEAPQVTNLDDDEDLSEFFKKFQENDEDAA